MASPTPAAIVLIQAHVSDWDRPDAEIAAGLNAELVPNPVPAPEVLPVLSLMSMFARVGTQTRSNILNWPNLAILRKDVLDGARDPVLNWLVAFTAVGMVTQAEYADLTSYLTTPAPDPNHPAELPWSTVHLGRPVDAEDVAAARPEE